LFSFLNFNYVLSLAISGNNIFAGTVDSGVYISTDNGTNWTQTSLNHKMIYSIAVNGNTVFAGTNFNGIYKSTNNGTTWTQTALNNQRVRALAVSGSNIIAGTDLNGVLISTNNGNNWVQTSLNNQLVICLTISGNNIFAGTGDYYGVWLSTNSGVNWTQTSLNNRSVHSIASIGNNIFAGTDGNGVYHSPNNGTNWFQKNQGFDNLYSVVSLFITNNYIFAGTSNSSVWRRLYVDILSIQNISTETPSKYSLSQNYPNPFNPTTNIRYAIPKSGMVKLVVFDALGREVETLVNESLKPGTYESAFNGSNYPSGIYFYKIQGSDFALTKRMILIK